MAREERLRERSETGRGHEKPHIATTNPNQVGVGSIVGGTPQDPAPSTNARKGQKSKAAIVKPSN